jgi:hypothetical protein
MIKEIIESDNNGHVSSGKFSISGLGGCMREKYFSLWKKYSKTFDNRVKRIFDLGDYVHRQCMNDLLTNAPSNGYEVFASEVNIPLHQYLSGRIDCILSDVSTGDKIVIDFKSTGSWTFDKVKKGEVPQNYLDQVNMYMHLLNIHKGYLLFVCKNNCEIHEHEVVYDRNRALDQIKQVEDFFINNVYIGKLPSKCVGGMFGCDVCEENDFDTMVAQQEIEDYIKNGKTYKELYS